MADSSLEPPPEELEGGPVKPFLEHLEDLRWTLIKCVAALALGIIVAGAATAPILHTLEWPLKRSGVVTDPAQFLKSLHPADPFTVIFQVALVGGMIFASPFLIYFLGQFFLPALTRRERRCVTPAFAAGGILFLAGVALSFFAVLPMALKVSFKMSELLGMVPDWRIQYYLTFCLWLLLGMGVAFEMPVVLLVLVKIGVVGARSLRRAWRWAIVGCLVFSAMLTPTGDPVTMLMFGAPLYLLYEISVWIALAMDRAARREAGDEAAGGLPPD